MALYALLVGVDTYRAPVPPLSGCVNDVRRMADFLELRADGAVLTLTDGEATRDGVIAAFRSQLGAARAGDTALFYFSGHGSQETTPAEFLAIEPDGLDETLVCVDSREPGRFDLADKELGALITEVAAGGAHVVVILDCCHSGTGTRDVRETVRRAPTDERRRPLESFLMAPEELGEREVGGSAWVTSPAPHVLLAACRDEEEAKEIPLGGERRGVFSYFLLETLQQATRTPTYRELSRQVTALVRGRVTQQWPEAEAIEPSDLDRPFLGGAVADRPGHVIVTRDPEHGWVIDAGAVHGIPPVRGEETTTLAVFDALPAGEPLGSARVTEVLPHLSRVELDFDAAERSYPALVVGLPLPRLGVRIDSDPVRSALADSLYVMEDADASLEVDGLRILREGRQLVADAGDAAEVVRRLEQIARWTRLAELRNPVSRLAANAVEITLYDAGTLTPLEPEHGDFAIAYSAPDRNPFIKLKLRNTTDQRLWCALLDLPETYAVVLGLLPGNRVRLDPGEEVWAFSNQPIPVTIPDALAARGYAELKDLLKLIVSTEPIDVSALAEQDLELPPVRSLTPAQPIASTLDRLLRRVATRHLGVAAAPEPVADWTTVELGLTVRRPAGALPVGASGVELAPGVMLAAHPALAGATARLDTPAETARSVGSRPAPALLLDDPEHSRPFELIATRSARPGPNVLVLEGVIDSDAVTEANPVVLRVDAPIEDHVLPVAWDGEQWLPLGYARAGGEIVLQRLPEPVIGTRSLRSAVSILFQKIVKPKLGLTFDYPQLAIVESDGRYVKAGVAERVAAAERIVVFVHGILGDTHGMAASAFAAPLAGTHDLVLAFDYENLKTPIEETARALGQRLAAAGLVPGHDKTLHLVAHSMGGLVSRWFIEREGGAAVVSRLVTLGTPNGGSPWPVVQKWATIAVGLGVNALATVAWPIGAFSGLLGLIEKVDVTLDQMEPGSTLLGGLAASKAPGVEYTLLAGNTSIIGGDERVTKLLVKLRIEAAGKAFFGEHNDIAVTVASASGVPAGWTPAPVVAEVACDHLTYFTVPASLERLAAALA